MINKTSDSKILDECIISSLNKKATGLIPTHVIDSAGKIVADSVGAAKEAVAPAVKSVVPPPLPPPPRSARPPAKVAPPTTGVQGITPLDLSTPAAPKPAVPKPVAPTVSAPSSSTIIPASGAPVTPRVPAAPAAAAAPVTPGLATAPTEAAATAAKATAKATAALSEIEIFSKRLANYIKAVEEVIANGKVITSTNEFATFSIDNLLKNGDRLLSPEVYGTWVSAIKKAQSEIPNTSTVYKKINMALTDLENARVTVFDSQRRLREYVEKAAETATAAATKAAETSAETVLPSIGQISSEAARIFTSAITDLRGVVSDLTKRNEEIIERLINQSYAAGYWKGVAKVAEKNSMDIPDEARIVKEISERTTQDTVKLTEKVKSQVPNPAQTGPVIDAASTKAAASGATDGTNAATEVIEEAKNASTQAGPAKVKGRVAMFLDNLILHAGKKAGANPMGAIGDATTLAVGGTKLLLGGVAIAAVILTVGAAATYWYFNSDSGEEIADELEAELTNTIALLTSGSITFRGKDSEGYTDTMELIKSYSEGIEALHVLKANLLDGGQLRKYAEDLNEIHVISQDYLDNEAEISQDLVSQTGWQDAISSIQEVARLTSLLAANILKNAKDADAEMVPTEETDGTSDSSAEGDVIPTRRPIAKPEEVNDSPLMEIPGTDLTLDINNAPRQDAGFRSAARRIVNIVLPSPPGLAFIDPEGAIWTGALTRNSRTPDENYYWRAIGYFYEHAINTPGKLRKHMRNQLERWKRGNGTAWSEALKYYSKKSGEKYSSMLFLNNIIKNADFEHFSKKSINKQGKSMKIKKFSDEHSNSYIQDALKGLSDEYSKSYFAGLKGMYDERLGSSEDDLGDIYHPLGGSGVQTLGEAHPESLTIAESMGKGGLIENLLEQQKSSYEVALSTPTGNFTNKHATLLGALVKEANRADVEGNQTLSNLIDEIIVELTNK